MIVSRQCHRCGTYEIASPFRFLDVFARGATFLLCASCREWMKRQIELRGAMEDTQYWFRPAGQYPAHVALKEVENKLRGITPPVLPVCDRCHCLLSSDGACQNPLCIHPAADQQLRLL